MTLISFHLFITPQARSAPPGRGDLRDARPAHAAGAAASGGAEATAAQHRPGLLTPSSQKLAAASSSSGARGVGSRVCARLGQFTCRPPLKTLPVPRRWVWSMRVYISFLLLFVNSRICSFSVAALVPPLPLLKLGCNPRSGQWHSRRAPLKHSTPFACRASVRTRSVSACRRSCAAQSCSRC